MVEPKFATKRDLRFPTRGTLQGLFARHWLGRTFMPWQQGLADVAGEYDPETGLPRYPLVIVPVQRQAGKSDLLMCTAGERCFSVPNFRSWYTAQTGRDARDQFLKFGEEVIEGTPLDMAVTKDVRLTAKQRARIGAQVFNLTGHFNPRDVQNNIGSATYGTFANSADRTVRAKFTLLF